MRKSSDPEVKKIRDTITLKPGMKVGKLTLLKYEKSCWYADCDCGTKNYCITHPYRLKNKLVSEIIGDTVQDSTGSCGCTQNKIFKNPNRAGITKTKYENITYSGIEILYRTDYIDNNRSVIIIGKCPKCGKSFPTTLRSEKTNCGCTQGKSPISIEKYILKNNCKSLNEEKIFNILTKNNIPFIYDKKFTDCLDKSYLPFDFYVNNKYIIEYDGEQHFKDIKFFNFEKIHKHDLIKNKYCFQHNIPLIRIPYNVEYTLNDLKLETTKFLLTPENEQKYYSLILMR